MKANIGIADRGVFKSHGVIGQSSTTLVYDLIYLGYRHSDAYKAFLPSRFTPHGPLELPTVKISKGALVAYQNYTLNVSRRRLQRPEHHLKLPIIAKYQCIVQKHWNWLFETRHELRKGQLGQYRDLDAMNKRFSPLPSCLSIGPSRVRLQSL